MKEWLESNLLPKTERIHWLFLKDFSWTTSEVVSRHNRLSFSFLSPPPSVFISSNLFKRCSGPFGNTIACVFCRTSYWLDLWKVCSRSLGTGDRPTLPLPSLAISHPCQMRSIASLRHCCCCSTVQWGQPHSEQKHLLLFVGWRTRILVLSSVTRLVDLLDFGQLFKAFGNNYFAQISHILRQYL